MRAVIAGVCVWKVRTGLIVQIVVVVVAASVVHNWL